jgi:hypothetical protein
MQIDLADEGPSMSIAAPSLFSLVFIVIGGAIVNYAIKMSAKARQSLSWPSRISPKPFWNPAVRPGSIFYTLQAAYSPPGAFSS